MRANICGKKLLKLRNERKLDQIEISAELSVSHDINIDQSDISEIERGVRGVKDFELKAFAEIFNVSADFLLKD